MQPVSLPGINGWKDSSVLPATPQSKSLEFSRYSSCFCVPWKRTGCLQGSFPHILSRTQVNVGANVIIDIFWGSWSGRLSQAEWELQGEVSGEELQKGPQAF